MQEHSLKEEDMLYPLLNRLLAGNHTSIVNAMRNMQEIAIWPVVSRAMLAQRFLVLSQIA